MKNLMNHALETKTMRQDLRISETKREGFVLGDGDACTGILAYLLDRLALAANDSPTVTVVDEHAQCDVTAYNILHCR